MAVSMMHNKKSSTWTTVKSKSDDKKKRTDEKNKQEVVEDRLGVTVPKKNVFAAMDAAWQKKAEEAAKVEDATPYAGAFTGLVVEQVALDEPDSPATPPNSDRQATTENGQRQNAEPKVKKPKKVKPSTSQIAQGLDTAALQASFQEWEEKYEGNEVSQLQMLADFFLKTFKECELPFNNILTEKSLDKASEVPLSEIPAGLSSAVQTFLAKKQDESLKSLVVLLLTATFEGLPEGFRSKTGVPPPKAKVGLLTLLALVLRTRPQALVAATPEILQGGRNYTAPGRIPQLLWVLNQSATISSSAAVAVWLRLLLPQLLGSEALGKKGEAAESKISVMDSIAHGPVLDYLELLLSKPVESDLELASIVVATVPGYALEAISQSYFAESQSSTRTRLQALFPRLQQLAASSTSPSHFLDWLPLALETACLSTAEFEGAGDEAVARATTSVVACLAGNVATHSLYSQKHKGQIKGSARVLQRLANSHASVLKPITSQKEVAASFGLLLAQLPARHKFYLHQGRGKGWQGAAARAADAAINKLQRRVTFAPASTSSSRGSYVLPALFAVTTVAGIIYAAQHRHALVAKASDYLSIDHSALLLKALESVDTVVDSGVDAVRPHVNSVLDVVQPHVETAKEAVRPHLESLSEQVKSLYEQAAGSELGLKAQAHVQAVGEKVQELISSLGSSNN